jgi:alkaline phosphatase D
MLPVVCLLATLALTAKASFEANLVYRSPHPNVPELGISTHRLRARQLDPQGQGVQQLRPPGPGDNYIRYGDSAIDWSHADYIYGGSVNFTHGVASGDPWDHSVLLWTRAVPLDVATRDVPVCLTYEVKTGANMTGVQVSKGVLYSSYDVDLTHKVEAKGLSPSTFYYYQFACVCSLSCGRQLYDAAQQLRQTGATQPGRSHQDGARQDCLVRRHPTLRSLLLLQLCVLLALAADLDVTP